MKNLLTQNSKLKHTSKLHRCRIYGFGLTPVLTCPCSGNCKHLCYAMQFRFTFKKTKAKLKYNYNESLKKSFVNRIQYELNKLRCTHVRINTSGDFYNAEYLEKWINLAECNPNIMFYGYTKSISLCKAYIIPNNMILRYSYGGIEDHLINPIKDRHAIICKDLKELKNKGLINGSKDDLQCIKPDLGLGLIYHGVRTYKPL